MPCAFRFGIRTSRESPIAFRYVPPCSDDPGRTRFASPWFHRYRTGQARMAENLMRPEAVLYPARCPSLAMEVAGYLPGRTRNMDQDRGYRTHLDSMRWSDRHERVFVAGHARLQPLPIGDPSGRFPGTLYD